MSHKVGTRVEDDKFFKIEGLYGKLDQEKKKQQKTKTTLPREWNVENI